jgi:hypothetical protein
MLPPIPAEVPLSFIEYKVFYREPLIHAAKLYSEVTPAVFHAMHPWHISLENVSYRQNAANLGEVAVTFLLLGGRVALTITLGFASVLVRDPNWSEAQLLTDIVRAGNGALFGSRNGLVSANQRVSVAMHVKPLTGQIKDLLARIVHPSQGVLTDSDVTAYGFSVYREDCSWLVDKSVLYSDALFVRVERVTGATIPIEEIASTLRKDEMILMDLLNLDIGLT